MGRLIIITGPTASGKDAVMHQLIKQNPSFQRIITTTTRTPRDLEREGIDYYFVSSQTFRNMQDEGEFLEVNQYGGNWYGTPKKEFTKVFDGHTTIWRVDPTMAGRAKDFFSSAFPQDKAQKLIDSTLIVYLDCQISILHDRLRRRGMSEEEIQKRTQQDKNNWLTYHDSFDKVVKSDSQVEETTKEVETVINT